MKIARTRSFQQYIYRLSSDRMNKLMSLKRPTSDDDYIKLVIAVFNGGVLWCSRGGADSVDALSTVSHALIDRFDSFNVGGASAGQLQRVHHVIGLAVHVLHCTHCAAPIRMSSLLNIDCRPFIATVCIARFLSNRQGRLWSTLIQNRAWRMKSYFRDAFHTFWLASIYQR